MASDPPRSPIKSDEEVIFFPTNATLEEGRWKIPVHGWIFEPERRSIRRKLLIRLLTTAMRALPAEGKNALFEERIRFFLVDNERLKKLTIKAGTGTATLPRSGANGHFRGEISVSARPSAARDDGSWMPYETLAADGRKFEGRAQLLAPGGLSVISDIDDTIKVSEVLDKVRLAERTFLREFEAVSGMAAVYRSWRQEGAVFHYVSASPWQLYPALAEFIGRADFPRGSLHLRDFRLKDASGLEFIGPSLSQTPKGTTRRAGGLIEGPSKGPHT